MAINKGMFTSNSEEWETPMELFDELAAEFLIGVDVCASPSNTKCCRYYHKGIDGLRQDWTEHKVPLWMNPPYGREISKWVKKAHEEAQRGAVIVALLPARTDTKWFHNYIYKKHEIRFIAGRLKFSGSHWNAPFPNMIVIFKKLMKE